MMFNWSSVFKLAIVSMVLTSVKSHKAENASNELKLQDEYNLQDFCKDYTCIRKCCPKDKYINLTSCDLPPNENSLWKPKFYNAENLTLGVTPPENLKYLFGLMQCEAFPVQPYVHPDDAFYLLQDGRLFVPLYKKYYNANSYCIDEFAISINETEEMALLCFAEESLTSVKPHEDKNISPVNNLQDHCNGFTCVRKCCPQDTFVNLTSCDTPRNESSLWKPTFYNPENMSPGVTPPKNLRYLYGLMKCEAFPMQPYIYPDDAFYLLQDGRLYVPLYKKYYDADSYCVDKFAVNIDETEEMALLCFPDEPVQKPNQACQVVKSYVYPMLLIVSCVFLIITLFVYIWIPELRGKLHGRCLMSLVCSLLVAYMVTTVVILASGEMQPTSCLICASLKHMTFLASFFWLNVMCFDIWRSLRSMLPASETSAKSKRRFTLYSVYAWGSSLFIGSVAVIIDTLPESYNKVIRPNYVNNNMYCWFHNNKSLWYYFYIVVLILLTSNMLFYLHVTYILYKSQNNPELKAARSKNRDRMLLYGKLFLVMGITWITEVISWKAGTCEAWIITDIINALQGFTIFLVFVCKKSTRKLVGKRLPSTKNLKFSRSTMTVTSSLGSRSTTRNIDMRTIANAAETRRLMDTTTNSPRVEDHQMTSLNQVEMHQNDNSMANGQTYNPEIDEDRPSIKRKSDISDGEDPNEERFGKQENRDNVGENPRQTLPPNNGIVEHQTTEAPSEEVFVGAQLTAAISGDSEPISCENIHHTSVDDNLEVSSEGTAKSSALEQSQSEGPEVKLSTKEAETGENESSPMLINEYVSHESPKELRS